MTKLAARWLYLFLTNSWMNIVSWTKLQLWRRVYHCDVGRNTKIQELRYLSSKDGPIRIGDNCQITALAPAWPISTGNHLLVNLFSRFSGRNSEVIIGNEVL